MSDSENLLPDLLNEELAVEFHPVDDAAATQIKETFTDVETLESSAFTGTDILTLIITSGLVGQVLQFYVNNRTRYKDAVIKVSGKEVSLQGYSPEELKEMIESGTLDKVQEVLKRK